MVSRLNRYFHGRVLGAVLAGLMSGGVGLALFTPSPPVRAQFVVIDPAILIQQIRDLIINTKQLAELVALYQNRIYDVQIKVANWRGYLSKNHLLKLISQLYYDIVGTRLWTDVFGLDPNAANFFENLMGIMDALYGLPKDVDEIERLYQAGYKAEAWARIRYRYEQYRRRMEQAYGPVRMVTFDRQLARERNDSIRELDLEFLRLGPNSEAQALQLGLAQRQLALRQTEATHATLDTILMALHENERKKINDAMLLEEHRLEAYRQHLDEPRPGLGRSRW